MIQLLTMSLQFIIPLLILIMVIPAYAQLQNINDIDIQVLNLKQIESQSSDVLVLELSIANNGGATSMVLGNALFLADSKSGEASAVSYLDLKDKGSQITSQDCPLVFTLKVNSGYSVNQNICYEVPKETGLTYSLKLYESTPEFCDQPYLDCKTKTYSIGMKPNQEIGNTSESKIPEWVRTTMKWFVDGQVSEDEMISALQFLIKQGIIKV